MKLKVRSAWPIRCYHLPIQPICPAKEEFQSLIPFNQTGRKDLALVFLVRACYTKKLGWKCCDSTSFRYSRMTVIFTWIKVKYRWKDFSGNRDSADFILLDSKFVKPVIRRGLLVEPAHAKFPFMEFSDNGILKRHSSPRQVGWFGRHHRKFVGSPSLLTQHTIERASQFARIWSQRWF